MIKKPLISAVINVRNEAEALNKCLRSIKNIADEIIIVDMSSTDGSQEIATNAGAKLYSYKPMKYVEPARNFALSKATGKWILLLDPDEFLNKTLKKELISITKRGDVDFVKIPRKNIIFGKWMRHSNSWPDYLIRFFKKGAVTWKKEIHSQPITKGNGITLLDSEKLAIQHNNYTSVSQFIIRAVRYSGIQADELFSSDYKIKTSDFVLKPIQEFNSRFFFAEGYKDGFHGLVFSILQAFAIALVYIRLWEKQGSQDKALTKESFVSASQETSFEYDFWFNKYFKNEYSSNIFKRFFLKIRLTLNYLTKNF
ncbi:MAG: glycosyltransferase family 2 protein [Candidatus Shapirobacteria bacterium]|jgi:(heptosyl)LPS beta-1,4-glucosyltransferase|nr:glycosyltransferase family 2 protein [Candidatus Shapirobacteria bacterium]